MRRIIAMATCSDMFDEDSGLEQRTAVFDETATLKEVFDWMRMKQDNPDLGESMASACWWNAHLSLHEDEMTKEEAPSVPSFEEDDEEISF
ncbi:MAG: hypothetical protein AB7S81_03390 [Bdellovibrionales bacterium]